MSDGVIQLKQEPVMVCACEGRSWYLVCEPAGAEPDHIYGNALRRYSGIVGQGVFDDLADGFIGLGHAVDAALHSVQIPSFGNPNTG